MGLGDALIAAGEARRARQPGRPPAVVVDSKGRPWWSDIFAFCADVGPETEGAARVQAGPKARPYIDYARSPDPKTRHAWQGYRPTPARLAVPATARERAAPAAGRIIVQPHLKARAPANKDWGWARWQALVTVLPGLPWLQVGQVGEQRLDGVAFLATPRAEDLFAAVERAAGVVAHEGFLHHAAAAFGKPAVVIFGGYVGPGATGYEGQRAFFEGAELHPLGCGWKLPCEHCRQAMEAITVERVAEAALALGVNDVPPLATGEQPAPEGLKQFSGIWLPAFEEHLPVWMAKRNEIVDGRQSYQWTKIQAALALVKNWRRALDIGAHCGLWSMQLAKRFERLEAFEPVPLYRDAFARNVIAGNCQVTLWDCALGDQPGQVTLCHDPGSSGDCWIVPGDPGRSHTATGAPGIPAAKAEIERLDDLLPDADDVDFVKLDCEGYELFALKGGEQLLRRCRPAVIVEQKPGRAQKYGLAQTEAVTWLQGLGAKLRREMSGDFLLSWE